MVLLDTLPPIGLLTVDAFALVDFDPSRSTVRSDEAPNEHAPCVTPYPEHEATKAYQRFAERIPDGTQGTQPDARSAET